MVNWDLLKTVALIPLAIVLGLILVVILFFVGGMIISRLLDWIESWEPSPTQTPSRLPKPSSYSLGAQNCVMVGGNPRL